MHQGLYQATTSGRLPVVSPASPKNQFDEMMSKAQNAKEIAIAEKFAKDNGVALNANHADTVHNVWCNQQLSQPEFYRQLEVERKAAGL